MSDAIQGIQELYCPPTEPVVDIVAVHGLNGEALRTWTTEKDGICWLNDPQMLPKLVPDARILTYGYNANVSSCMGGPTSSDRVMDHAHTFVATLAAHRTGELESQRPIIFLCHSLGGIVVKRALIYSRRCTSLKIENLHKIYTCTYGILFFGTPHHGSPKARHLSRLFSVATAIIPTRILELEMSLLKALESHSEQLDNITDDFAPLMKQYRISCFWEQQKTNLKFTKDYIVDRYSAVPDIGDVDKHGIAADHREMCRFHDPNSSGYRTVVAKILQYKVQAPQVIAKRYEDEKALLWRQRIGEAAELLSIDVDVLIERLALTTRNSAP